MLFYILLIVIVIFDQLTKLWVINNFYPGQSRPIIEGIFHLTYVQNRGAGFGILQGQRLFFIISSLIIIVILIIYRYRSERNLLLDIGLSMIIAGAVGNNLIDRVIKDFVVDFLDFRIWPVFNLADTAIVIGVGLLVIYLWKLDIENKNKTEEDSMGD